MSISLVAKNRVKAIGSISFRVLIVPLFLVFEAIYCGIVRSVRFLAKLISEKLYLAPIVPIIIVPVAIVSSVQAYVTEFEKKVVEPISSSIFLCRSVTWRAKFIMNRVEKVVLLEPGLRGKLFGKFCVSEISNMQDAQKVSLKFDRIEKKIETCAEECNRFALENLKAKEITLGMVSKFEISCSIMRAFMMEYRDLFSEILGIDSDELEEYSNLINKFREDIGFLRNNICYELEKIAEASNKSSQISNESDAPQALGNAPGKHASDKVEKIANAEDKPALEISNAFSASPATNSSEPSR